MGKGYTLEKHMRVYDDDNGHFVTVRPDADGFGCVALLTEGPEADYFGSVRLSVPPQMARLLAEALIEVADNVEKMP